MSKPRTQLVAKLASLETSVLISLVRVLALDTTKSGIVLSGLASRQLVTRMPADEWDALMDEVDQEITNQP